MSSSNDDLAGALRGMLDYFALRIPVGEFDEIWTVKRARKALEEAGWPPGPDPMPAGWNRPAPATKGELLDLLHDVEQAIRADDSMEGFITWSIPDPEPCPGCGGTGHHRGSEFVRCGDCRGHGMGEYPEGVDFGLMARYRVGNSDGSQGGLSVFSPGPLPPYAALEEETDA